MDDFKNAPAFQSKTQRCCVMTAYYNEFDPFAAAWLRELIKEGHIAYGEVDERSIEEVQANDLKGFTQHHFFAGIGGWSYALRLAGWADDRPVWTGSCPCQSYSSAGKQKGREDERHLWPTWRDLIKQHHPATIFGEQVAGAIAFGWLDEVFFDLEAETYSCAAAVLPACSVGAPHKRDRLWFVGHSESARTTSRARICKRPRNDPVRSGKSDAEWSMANSTGAGFQNGRGAPLVQPGAEQELERLRSNGDVANSTGAGSSPERAGAILGQLAASNWQSGVWIDCPDGKQRLVEPSIRLLANGVSNRVGKLRGYGNAIVAPLAAEFIKASMECINV